MTPNQCAWNAVQARRTLPHGQRPTDLHVRIAFVLARWQHASPCHAKLARAAHCHRNSRTQRAAPAARAWSHRVGTADAGRAWVAHPDRQSLPVREQSCFAASPHGAAKEG